MRRFIARWRPILGSLVSTRSIVILPLRGRVRGHWNGALGGEAVQEGGGEAEGQVRLAKPDGEKEGRAGRGAVRGGEAQLQHGIVGDDAVAQLRLARGTRHRAVEGGVDGARAGRAGCLVQIAAEHVRHVVDLRHGEARGPGALSTVSREVGWKGVE